VEFRPREHHCKGLSPNRVSFRPCSSYNRFTSGIILVGKIVDCGFDCRVFAIFNCSTPVATAHLRARERAIG
jgi:hypothetical protein